MKTSLVCPDTDIIGGENGFDDGRLEESGLLPTCYGDIAKVTGRMHLAGHGHEDDIRAGEFGSLR